MIYSDATLTALARLFDTTDAWSRGRLLIIHDRSWWRECRRDWLSRYHWFGYILDTDGAHGVALGPLTVWWEPREDASC